MVVLLHAYFSAPPSALRSEEIGLRVIHLFAHAAVPIFFFASAYLLAREPDRGTRAWWRARATRIFLPACIWMAATFAYRAVHLNEPIATLWRPLFEFNISGQYYFIADLAIFFALFSAVRLRRGRPLAALLVVAFVATALTLLWYETHVPRGAGAVAPYRNPLTWLAFAATGYAAAVRQPDLRWTARWRFLALAGMAASGAAYFIQGEAFNRYPASYFSLAQLAFTSCAIVALLGFLQNGRAAAAVLHPFRVLSDYSLGIYFIHMPFFIGYANEWIEPRTEFDDRYLPWVATRAAIGLGGSFAVIWLCRRVSPPIAAVLFGVRGRRGGTPRLRGMVRPRSPSSPRAAR